MSTNATCVFSDIESKKCGRPFMDDLRERVKNCLEMYHIIHKGHGNRIPGYETQLRDVWL